MAETVHYRKDYTPSRYQILSTHLSFELREHETIVTNVMEIERTATTAVPLVLNGENQELFTLKLNGSHVPREHYEWTDTTLSITDLPSQFTLEVVSRLHPESNTSYMGLYKTQGTFCTQCEAEGFRKMTFYLDRPDVLALFTTKIIADKQRYPVLLSNGNLLEQGDLEQGRHYAIWQDPFRKPCYLFALVAGDIQKVTDTFTTMSDRSVQLEIYAQGQYIGQCGYALEALKDAMRWDEIRFGREYDLDRYMIYAAEDFNMGAMENKGLNIFNTKFVLTDPKLSTDHDYEMTQAVIAHEYFHNWTGNRVTCRDWFQLSLKEGLTVFRDAEFTADHHDRTIKRIQDATYMRTSQFAEDRSPMAHPIRPDSYVEMNNFYTVTVYEKGAEVIRMMHTLLGEIGFRQGMELYFKRHDGQAVTCDDFVAAMADANHYDLALFKNWYSQASTPLVKVSSSYDAKTHNYTLNFEQSLLLHTPIKLGLLSLEGEALQFEYQGKIEREIIYSLKDHQASLTLKHVQDEPIPSLLRDFSAPVKLEYAYSRQDLIVLAKHDPNLFNRWDAKERLLSAILLEAYHGKPLDTGMVVDIFKQALQNAFAYPAYSAELLSVPTLKALAEQLPKIDPKKLIAVRESLVKAISHDLHKAWLACYEQAVALEQQAKHGAALRTLKNLCLSYLGWQNQFTLLETQYTKTSNMTDRLAAFAAIVNTDNTALKDKIIQDFFERYQDYPLVVDKWLLTKASSRAEDTFSRFEALLTHPAFNRSNPNKIYNLVLGFANNFTAFHREDGKGYDAFGKFVAEIDGKNPMVAARLVKSLMNFKQFVAPYSKAMQQALCHLQALPTLSKDVGEIVNKALMS